MAIQAQAYQGDLLGLPVCGNSQEFFKGVGGYGDAIHGDNGCGLSFNGQQFIQKQVRKQSAYHKGFSPSTSRPQSLPSQIDQHDLEIDQYLHLQSARLRLALQQQRKQQTAELLKRIETRSQMLIAHKDQEISHAVQKTSELQELLARLEMEREEWRRLAEEKEAMATSLNNTLEELRKDRACSTSKPQEPCFEVDNRGAGEPEEGEGTGENTMVVEGAAACRGCGCRGASVVFLPCRHLCTCEMCSEVLDFCPVCDTAKKACLEALMA
ncbi:hypothetical protein SAY87_002721 [Trapa incisa]|uniref:Uncharacterized protein n=2 Tax=Trapa TaxID=22665 RepID=A0AAN7KAW1_TRANT|nr:hypothetical protein SAY87_002721 [Trapa incisa]KAK4765373.1 hypothetical protein SAY86_026463 [Trapa natans]